MQCWEHQMSSKQIIDIVLPFKETFTPLNAGAVATVVSDLTYHSMLDCEMHIYGRPLSSPSFPQLSYYPLKPKWPLLFGNNIGIARSYIANLNRREISPALIEVHGRCQVARIIAKMRKDLKVALFLHNDPRTMNGGKTREERLWLSKNLAGIFTNSAYIKNCFLDGFNQQEIAETPIFLTPLGANRTLTQKPLKQNVIIIASRIVPEKGILEVTKALCDILPEFPEWKVKIIGAKHFANHSMSDYEKSVRLALSPLKNQAEMLGFLPLAEVNKELAEAAIAIVPSVWQEPASRAVLEALANGCALITTRRGGIPERAEGRAILIDNPNHRSFSNAIKSVISDPNIRAKLQDIAWQDYPFDCANMAQQTDQARKHAMGV